jgi:hypothetical protein
MSPWFVRLAAAGFVSASITVQAQNISLTSSIYHEIRSIEQSQYANGYLFAACGGAGLRVFDVSDPQDVVQVGMYDAFDNFSRKVVVNGSTAFLADRSHFRTINVSDPQNPTLLGSLLYGEVIELKVEGSLAYLAVGWGGLKLVDVGNPANPVLMDEFREPNGSPMMGFVRCVEAYGAYTYVCDDRDDIRRLRVFDTSDPYSIELVQSLELPGFPEHMLRVDDELYILSGHHGMEIYSLDDPVTPVLISTIDTPDYAFNATLFEENILAVADLGSVIFFDISDPAALIQLANYDCFCGGPKLDISFNSNIMFTSLSGDGLNVSSIDLPNAINISNYRVGVINGVALKNNHAYAITRKKQIFIADVSSPDNPIEVGTFSLSNSPWAVMPHELSDVLYVALEGSGILILDISDPEIPQQITILPTQGPSVNLDIHGDMLLSSNVWNGVQLFDISDPENPVSRSTFGGTEVYYASLSDDYAFVSSNNGGGLLIFNVSDMENPELLSTIDITGIQQTIYRDGILFVSKWDNGISAYDLTNPGSPTFISRFQTPVISSDMTFVGNILISSDGGAGVTAVDYSDVSTPILAGSFRTDWDALGLDVSGQYAFVATEYHVQVLDLSQLLPASGESAFLPLDPCEEGTSGWTAWSNGSTELAMDTQLAQVGGASLRAHTTGDLMSFTWTTPGTTALDLSAATAMRLWTQVENDLPFQMNAPRVRLGSGSDYIEFTPATNVLSGAYGQWLEIVMPLSGGNGWSRSEQGMSSLESVRWIEFYADTWDYDFTWWLDGLGFEPVGIATDCNGNQVADAVDVALGTSLDLNGNGLPDECEECVLPLVDITLPYTGYGNTVGAADVIGSSAGEVAYRFTLADPASVAFNSCHPGTAFDTDSYLFAGGGPCDGGTQLLFNAVGLACATRPGASNWTQADLPAGSYVLLVTGAGGEEGDFTFTLHTPVSQELPVDAHTQLLLRFNNSTTGVQGETPIISSGVTYAAGRVDQGASLSTGDRLTYSHPNNITATQGTVEGWIKPEWNGNDGQTHLLLTWGAGGGLLMGKDGANNWRIILNRYGNGGQPENGVATNIGHWVANQWHHVAFSWDASSMKAYVDGSLAAEAPVTITLPAITTSTFQVGGEGTGSSLRAVVDEFRISDIARTAQEIADSYALGLQILSFYAEPDEITLYPTWHHTPSLTALTDLGQVPVPAILADWNSASPGVAAVDEDGRITALAGGTALVTATYQGLVAPITVHVTPPLLQPIVEPLDPFLTIPAAGAVYEMPVVIISYLPTQDGVNLDANLADWGNPLDEMRQFIAQKDIRVKFALEEGSKFRGYDNPDAQPSLGYRVVEKITVFEPLPLGPGGPDFFQPDYEQILTRFDARHWVEDLGVKEIWLWGYHHGNLYPVESNMSSPTTGDISNSYRINDLPVYDRTYVLYNYNFTRSQAEAVHNHGHQLEAILSHVNWLQDGNSHLFWRQFSGQDATGNTILGRCGNTHIPPNTTNHYDYLNPATVQSDIRNWSPAGGPTTAVNFHTWGDHPYAWPYGEWNFGQREETQWYIYWMQSMPGFRSTIPYNATRMTNWWVFTADWDTAILAELGLYGAPTPAAPQVSAVVQGNDVLLQWNPVGDVNYMVYRAADFHSPFQYLGKTTGTSYLDAGVLSAGPHGRYQVLASYPAID